MLPQTGDHWSPLRSWYIFLRTHLWRVRRAGACSCRFCLYKFWRGGQGPALRCWRTSLKLTPYNRKKSPLSRGFLYFIPYIYSVVSFWRLYLVPMLSVVNRSFPYLSNRVALPSVMASHSSGVKDKVRNNRISIWAVCHGASVPNSSLSVPCFSTIFCA